MSTKIYKLLIVISNPKNAELLDTALKQFGFICFIATNYDQTDDLLKNADNFDLILIDISGFDVNIWNRCKTIHQLKIPFFILSSQQSDILQHNAIRYGAKAIILKPVILRKFVNLIFSIIENEEKQ